jgi:hypothetical protein
MNGSLTMAKAALDDLIALLWREGFKVLGPAVRDSGVAFSEVRKTTCRSECVNRRRLAATAWARASTEKSSAW